ncbi:class I SAM-dependent methyltransferase [Nocardioides cheoyonin]|uniref:class I SAM-dependent methyltransferase n=1 Tax=Nocardioides cheoyonin TaxID=3156615 RepID=UPI0032B52B9C
MSLTSNAPIRDGRTPEDRERDFLPGMGKPWLLPLYDVFSRAAGVRRLHERAAALADVGTGESVLDVGCGTGNLAFAILRATPDAHVTGLDPDPAALRRAARKAGRRGVRLDLVQGFADQLPAEDSSLDHVVSSLALHHVDDAGREGFAREALRVLRPGGGVTILDFGGPGPDGESVHHADAHSHGIGLMRRLRHRMMHNAHVARNLDEGLVVLLRRAGFAEVREVEHLEHRMGEVTVVRATRAE